MPKNDRQDKTKSDATPEDTYKKSKTQKRKAYSAALRERPDSTWADMPRMTFTISGETGRSAKTKR